MERTGIGENIGKDISKEVLRESSLMFGADEFAVADLNLIREYLKYEYGNVWDAYTRAVSFAVYLPPEVAAQLINGPTRVYLMCYDAINIRINEVSLRISSLLTRGGYRAFPIPASQRMGEDKLAAIFSHRAAARLSGLGWIGKSANLINPVVGPCLRLGTVLTDAPLPADSPLEKDCGECQLCRDICPAQAIKGRNFDAERGLDYMLDVFACDDYLGEIRHVFGKRICGRCLAVCPYGQRYRHTAL